MNLRELANEYFTLRETIKNAELRQKELKTLAYDVTGNSVVDVHLEDDRLARFREKSSTRSSCDYTKLKEEHRQAYDACVSSSSFSYLDIRKVRA